MATRTEMLADRSECGQEALGMAGRLEASHRSFSLARWLMRILRTVIQPFVLPVLNTHQDLPLRCAIAGKLVRDEHTGHILAAFQKFAEEFLRRALLRRL